MIYLLSQKIGVRLQVKIKLKGGGRREKGEGRKEKGKRKKEKGEGNYGVNRLCRFCINTVDAFQNYFQAGALKPEAKSVHIILYSFYLLFQL